MTAVMISTTQDLADFCHRQHGAAYITVDTEFMREKTFWPRLCLVQVGGPDEAETIDPLAPNMDLTPLFDLMRDESVLKVFHAARQDIEIFWHLMGDLPRPVFDTQVAAMVCGFGEQAGYETLVSKLTKGKVDKSSRFTDWSLRPLSDKQVHYALSDVTHLRVIYEKIRTKLEKNGRAGWLDEEMAVLTSPDTYAADPRAAFRRLKVRNPKPRFLAVLREVAAWRDEEAQHRDLPRNRVLRDEAILEIAHHLPKTVADLARTRGLGQRLAEGQAGQALLDAVKTGLAVPDEDCPKPKEKIDLPRGIGPVSDLLRVLLKMRCEDADVAPKLVASSADVEKIAAFGQDADVPALHGWRFDIFGSDAIQLRDGKAGIALNGNRLEMVDLEDPEDEED